MQERGKFFLKIRNNICGKHGGCPPVGAARRSSAALSFSQYSPSWLHKFKALHPCSLAFFAWGIRTKGRLTMVILLPWLPSSPCQSDFDSFCAKNVICVEEDLESRLILSLGWIMTTSLGNFHSKSSAAFCPRTFCWSFVVTSCLFTCWCRLLEVECMTV